MTDYNFAPAFVSSFFTPLYDLIVELGGLGKSLQAKILKHSQIRNGESILDVGCGTATFLLLAGKEYPKCKLVGIDPDEEILKIAKNKLEKANIPAQILNAWAEKLPFKSSSFDLVVCSLTFHHMPLKTKKETLKESRRVLKPTGRFLLADIGKPQNIFWKIKFLVDTERIFKVKEYMEDNLQGKLLTLMRKEGFTVRDMGPRHRNIQFLLGKKTKLGSRENQRSTG